MTDKPTSSGFTKKMIGRTSVQKALAWLGQLHRYFGGAQDWKEIKRVKAMVERSEKIELILKRVLNEHGIECDNCRADAEKVLKPLE